MMAGRKLHRAGSERDGRSLRPLLLSPLAVAQWTGRQLRYLRRRYRPVGHRREALGVPVWRLLGGPIHRELRAYFTHWHAVLKQRSPEALAEHAVATVSQGWTAVKWTLPLSGAEPERLKQAMAEIEAVRKAVG